MIMLEYNSERLLDKLFCYSVSSENCKSFSWYHFIDWMYWRQPLANMVVTSYPALKFREFEKMIIIVNQAYHHKWEANSRSRAIASTPIWLNWEIMQQNANYLHSSLICHCWISSRSHGDKSKSKRFWQYVNTYSNIY